MNSMDRHFMAQALRDHPLPWSVNGSETHGTVWVQDANGRRVMTPPRGSEHDTSLCEMVVACVNSGMREA